MAVCMHILMCVFIGKALEEGKQWYFFSRKTQNERVTNNGYWKALGIEEAVLSSSSRRVGTKKYFVFYLGESPSGDKTNWIMHEYHLLADSSSFSSSSSSRSSSKRRSTKKIVSIYNTCYLYLYLCMLCICVCTNLLE